MSETEVMPPEIPPPSQTTAIVRQTTGAVGDALSVEQVGQQLEYIRQVMRQNMAEGTDYGKVPGCGDKPGLFQPGAQKLGLTFQLTPSVKQETLKEFAPYHREYSFIVTVTSKTGRQWDGVGTCSTLESKYRYRKAERRCPTCGKHTIIQGKEEYGGGWVCFKKKGGCGAKFPFNNADISSQKAGQVENENPPDAWNTVRKMAFKRAFVHAIINATNTSDLWSQDLDDLPNGSEDPESPPRPPTASQAPGPSQHPTTPPKPSLKPARKQEQPVSATPEQRERFLTLLKGHETAAKAYFEDQNWLLPTESLEMLPAIHFPVTKSHADKIIAAVTDWERTHQATEPTGQEVPNRPADWWRGIIVPIPRAGQKRDEYLKAPDTIGSLYDQRHDEDGAGRNRLFGFIDHFEPSRTWKGADGKEHERSQTEFDVQTQFRAALDACKAFIDANANDPEKDIIQ